MKNKILLLSTEFPPQPGGIGHQAFNLARELTAAGRELTVLTNSRGHKDRAKEQAFDGLLPFKVVRVPRYTLTAFSYLMRLIRLLKIRIKYPSCTLISSGQFSLWMGYLVKKLFPETYTISILHGTELGGGPFRKSLTNKSLSAYDQHVAVSGFTQNRMLHAHPAAQIRVINNGFDPDKFSRRTGKNPIKKRGYPTLITLGNLSRRKGQHQVIQALPALRKIYPDIHYHLVGIPTEQERLYALAEKLGVLPQVDLHGPLDDAATADLLQASDVFVLLSENTPEGDVEGFGIAILEANALGLPAIGSTGCGIEDAIRDGYSGKLVDAQNQTEISAALKEILKNHPVYAENARIWANSFTWKIKGQEYLELIP